MSKRERGTPAPVHLEPPRIQAGEIVRLKGAYWIALGVQAGNLVLKHGGHSMGTAKLVHEAIRRAAQEAGTP